MFDAYIFDLDGTLVDIKDITWFRKFQRRVYEEFGVFLPPDDDLYTALKLPNRESNEYLMGLGIKEPRDYWKRLEEEDYKERDRLLDTGFLKAYSDVGGLDRLYGRIAMVTNTPESVARLELRRTGLMHYFELLYATQYNEEYSKPHPHGINYVLEKMGVSPKKALMIGDSELDIMAGEAAGVYTAQLIRSHFHNYDKTTPTFSIRSLYELPALKAPEE